MLLLLWVLQVRACPMGCSSGACADPVSSPLSSDAEFHVWLSHDSEDLSLHVQYDFQCLV